MKMYAQVPSPNFSDVDIIPRFIVIHYTASKTASSAISWMANPDSKVSAHLVISRTGEVTQMVDFNKKAWHAGPSAHSGWRNLNNCSIGIELVNTGKQGYPAAQLCALTDVIARLRTEFKSIFAVVGHSEIDTETDNKLRKKDPGPLFPWHDFRIKTDAEVFEVIPARLNVRSSPSTGNTIKGTVSAGDEVVVLAHYGDWVRIDTGYLHNNFIRRVK